MGPTTELLGYISKFIYNIDIVLFFFFQGIDIVLGNTPHVQSKVTMHMRRKFHIPCFVLHRTCYHYLIVFFFFFVNLQHQRPIKWEYSSDGVEHMHFCFPNSVGIKIWLVWILTSFTAACEHTCVAPRSLVFSRTRDCKCNCTNHQN